MLETFKTLWSFALDKGLLGDSPPANPTRETVDILAKQFGKTVRSIIAKLSREGVYIAQPRVTKSGEPVVRKAELVAQINAKLGEEFPTLVKASKVDLQNLVNHLS